MRKGWEYKKLGEVATFINGDRGKNYPSAKDFVESGVPFINAGHLNNGIISYDKMNYITINKYNSLGSGKIIKNDILFCLRGSLGKYAIVAEDSMGAIASSLVIIRPFQNADNRFIAHFLSSAKIKEYIAKNNNGSSQPNLSAKSVASFIIPLPPLSTQLAIVTELDKINELIRLKKEQLKNFDNLAQSLFYEMFGDPVENEMGWEVKKLNEIVSDNCSISYGIVQPGDGVENGVPVVRPVDMTKTFVSRKGLKNTTKEISDSYKRTILKGNEILMCVRGTTGLISMATPELQGCNVTRGIAPIECGPTCDKWFVFYQILNPAIQHHIAEYTRGIALKQINMKDVRDIPLCLPPLPLQRLFAQRIEQIEREKSEVQKSIQDLEILLASRMQYWFE